MADHRSEQAYDAPHPGGTSRQIDHECRAPHSRLPPEQQGQGTARRGEVHALLDAGEFPIEQPDGHCGGEIRPLVAGSSNREHNVDAIPIAPAAQLTRREALIVANVETFDQGSGGPGFGDGARDRRQRPATLVSEPQDANRKRFRGLHAP